MWGLLLAVFPPGANQLLTDTRHNRAVILLCQSEQSENKSMKSTNRKVASKTATNMDEINAAAQLVEVDILDLIIDYYENFSFQQRKTL